MKKKMFRKILATILFLVTVFMVSADAQLVTMVDDATGERIQGVFFPLEDTDSLLDSIFISYDLLELLHSFHEVIESEKSDLLDSMNKMMSGSITEEEFQRRFQYFFLITSEEDAKHGMDTYIITQRYKEIYPLFENFMYLLYNINKEEVGDDE
jgi:hypothetical protein